MVVGTALLLLSNCARAQIPEENARQRACDVVRSRLNLRASQFLDIHRDEGLEQSLALTASRQVGPEFIYRLSLTGYEIKEKTIIQHSSTDGDFVYIVAVDAINGKVYLIHGFPDSLPEFEKLMMSARLTVSSPDRAEAVAAFYQQVNPENRSISAIANIFGLKQAAERQCQTIPFEAGDREFESWWKNARPLYTNVAFDQTATRHDDGYVVAWTVLSSAGSGACGGAALRAELEVGKDGQVGKVTFVPVRQNHQ